MAANKTLLVDKNVIIESDTQGHNFIKHLRDLKYNTLINNRNAACLLRKNIIVIDNNDVPNTIIEADNSGNNSIKSFDEYATEEIDLNSRNMFKDLLIKTRKKKEVHNSLIDIYLTEKRESLQDKLRRASELYQANLYARANELYETALDSIKYDSYPDEFMLDECDIIAIKFALALSKIGVNDGASLQTSEEILISLIDKHGTKFPSMHHYLAKVYYSLNKYKKAQMVLENGLEILKNLKYLIELNWPGTKDKMIEKSTKNIEQTNMLDLLEQCSICHLPDAKCIFQYCDIDNKSIYFDSPVFIGYVSVKCTNKCNFTYHRACWKRKLKWDGIKKQSSFLDKQCATHDCYGLINHIIIYNRGLNIMSTISSSKQQDQTKGVKNDCKLDKKSKSDENKKEESNTTTKTDDKKLETKLFWKVSEISQTLGSVEHDLSSIKNSEDVKIKLEPKTTEKISNISTLNTNAKEYIPQNIKKGKENLLVHSNLNTNAQEYVPPIRVVKMLEHKNYSEKSTQSTEHFVSQAEYDIQKRDKLLMQAELFKSEESYNDLLSQFELLKTSQEEKLKARREVCTETDLFPCESCLNFETNLKEKDLSFFNSMRHDNGKEIYGISCVVRETRSSCTYYSVNEQLELKIKELQHEINELKTARLLDQEIFRQNELKFIESNRVLVQKIQELTFQKDNILKEFREYNTPNNISIFQNLLLKQITQARNFYLGYVATFENKCKHMIWELADIKTLSSSETLPSLDEVEENLIMWKTALDDAVKNHGFVMLYYDKLIKNYATETSEDMFIAPLKLVAEPPSIILRHFKSLFVLNRKLEQDLERHTINYYKMLTMPYPGSYPYGMTQSPTPSLQITLQPDVKSPPERNICLEEGQVALNGVNPPPGLGVEPVDLTQEIVVADVNEEVSEIELNISQDKSDLAVENTSELPEISSENIEPVSGENVQQNENIRPYEEATTAVSSKQQEVQTVIGTDGLLYKLQQKYPLTPPRILQEAIKTVRESHGSLTGMDCKTLMSELRLIIKDLAKKEQKKPGYQKINVKEKPSPPNAWAPINTTVKWENDNPFGNCSICFEKMNRTDSIQLRCQHVFHTKCIRTWLSSNGICPICRSFTTLDDEFPPLK